jgi:hypothetical protein
MVGEGHVGFEPGRHRMSVRRELVYGSGWGNGSGLWRLRDEAWGAFWVWMVVEVQERKRDLLRTVPLWQMSDIAECV